MKPIRFPFLFNLGLVVSLVLTLATVCFAFTQHPVAMLVSLATDGAITTWCLAWLLETVHENGLVEG